MCPARALNEELEINCCLSFDSFRHRLKMMIFVDADDPYAEKAKWRALIYVRNPDNYYILSEALEQSPDSSEVVRKL
jgi:hypothetical protein